MAADPTEIEIFISSLGASGDMEAKLKIEPGLTVADLKKKYHEEKNVEVESQTMLIDGKELEDAALLADAGVVEGAKLQCIVHYDVIVMGTGLKECILSGLMSVERKKVLHIDRNDYYGAESASMNLEQMFTKFKDGATPPESMGRSRDYNIDLIPKFVIGSGTLVSLLLYTSTNRYLDFKVVDGSYVYRGGKIYKVPTTATEVMGSSLMGFFEKRKCKQFVDWVENYDKSKPKSMQGLDIDVVPMKDVYKYFGLGPDVQDFIGHSFALFSDDTYLDKPAKDTIESVRLYVNSLARYEKSPFLYPLYGLGDVPQGFARLSAIYGGTYMLRQPVEEILYNKDGTVHGMRSGGQVATCDTVIADPSYFPDKTKKVGQVVRAICVLNHPIPNTTDAESCQIVIPQRQAKRNSDIYVFCVSAAHQVAPAGRWVAILSTRVETDNPVEELKPAFALLGAVEDQYISICDLLEPTNDPTADKCFISASYDETSHFQSTCSDVCELYEKINGVPIDFQNPPPQPGTPEFETYTGPGKGKKAAE